MAVTTKRKSKEISSVYLNIGFKELIKERGINLSELVNSAMKGILEVDSTLDGLKKKKRELIVQISVVDSQIQKVEGEAMNKLTDDKIESAEQDLRDFKIKGWLKVAKHKKKQEGKVPPAIEIHWANKIGCTVEELYEFK